MIRDSATCQANYERFVSRVVSSEEVWYLSGENGAAICESYDFEDCDVIMFFSDKAYAKRAKEQSLNEYEVQSMSLFDFLFRWLVGMAEDGVAAGTNWTGDLVGLEFDPQDLKEEIEKAMDKEMLTIYIAKLDRQISEQKNA
ncbi:DUF2750 domain-containing protein [Zooshikella marina]|uniref:DUF2750 domain-containing protein n=1 Tax=Zooshikella ganghwensis TaxID=202772 RepID=UPI001BB04AAD|nr:DUF2750 domain-containing protein [Zooshikella ganghwensis]MBU2708939.1 DUF2750 domain-containing protein [Zooshikella ganghwensis]